MLKPYPWLERFLHLSILSMAGALILSGCNGSSITTNPGTTTAPTISSFTASQTAIEPGGSATLSWQTSGSTPLTLSLNQGIGTVSGNSYIVSPSVSTVYTLTATNSAGQVSKNLTITVTAPANTAPTVSNTITTKSVTQGAAAQTIDLKTIFADTEDGSTGLGFSASSTNLAVVGPSVAGSTLTLNFGNPGTAQVTVTAKDSGNLSVSTSFSVSVASNGNPPTNQAPVVVSPVGNKTVTQGTTAQTIDLKTVFADAEDGTNLTYSALSSNTGVATVSVSGSTLTLTFGTTGTAQITLTAKDSGNLSVNSTFGVTVNASVPLNQAPTLLSPISSKNVNQGAVAQTVNLSTIFTDAEDGSNLSYTASSSNPTVVSTSVSSNTLTLTFGSVGTAQVSVTAKDSGNLTNSTSFSVTVASGGTPTNTAPTVVSTIAAKSVSQGAAAQTVNLATVFTDAQDGTNLTYSASSSNTGVVSTSVSGSTLTLTFGTTGTAQVTATAKDSGNLSVSTSFSVTVGSSGGGGTTSCISTNFMAVTPYAGNTALGLPDPTLTVTCSNGKAMVATNAIPNHQTGTFPNANNPNTISAQNRTYPLTLSPSLAASVTVQTLTTMGMAINGIAFEPNANEYYNNDKTSGWQYEAMSYTVLHLGKNLGLDSSSAHVQPTGNYHYHGLPYGLVSLLNKGTAMTLIGYIGDGFPIYATYGYNTATDALSGTKEMNSSYRLKSGTRPSGPGGTYDGTFQQDYEYVAGLGDLDACNGRFGVTPEYPSGIYHYYITKSYPYIPRCFSGTPESMYITAPK